MPQKFSIKQVEGDEDEEK